MIVGVSAKSHERELLDSAFGGFVVLLSLNGKVIFTTKGITTHTGINQVMTLKLNELHVLGITLLALLDNLRSFPSRWI